MCDAGQRASCHVRCCGLGIAGAAVAPDSVPGGLVVVVVVVGS